MPLSGYTVLRCYIRKAYHGLINFLLDQILPHALYLLGTCLKSRNLLFWGKYLQVHISQSDPTEIQRSGEHLYEIAICTIKQSHLKNYL